MKRRKILIAQIAVLAAVPLVIWAYAEGPIAGVAGVPGESDCRYCHYGPGGSGSVKVVFPGGLTYKPGVTQHLLVTVADPAQVRWGFELTARKASDSTAQAGSFTPGSDGYTQLVCTQQAFQTEAWGNTCDPSMPLAYIEHTWNGTRPGQQGSADFQFDWTPPATDVGDVVTYVAGNAANGDGGTGGDNIYLASYTLSAVQSNQPTITKVLNSGSLQPGIPAAAWFTIEGTDLANTTRTWRTSDIVNGKLPTQLDGVSVTVGGKPAYVYYISPTVINAQAPDGSPGQVSVKVANNGVTGAAMTAQMHTIAPAFFQWGKYSVATRTDYSLVGPPNLFKGATTVPARPGDVILLWGTGFGPTSPAVPAGEEAPLTQSSSTVNKPTVMIGGVAATVHGAALTPGEAGLYLVVVTVPNSLADGDQPVVAQVAGVTSPSGVYLNVHH